jgi:hypothetical protein
LNKWFFKFLKAKEKIQQMLSWAHSNNIQLVGYTINADALLLLEWPQVGATDSLALSSSVRVYFLLYRPTYKSEDLVLFHSTIGNGRERDAHTADELFQVKVIV